MSITPFRWGPNGRQFQSVPITFTCVGAFGGPGIAVFVDVSKEQPRVLMIHEFDILGSLVDAAFTNPVVKNAEGLELWASTVTDKPENLGELVKWTRKRKEEVRGACDLLHPAVPFQ